MSLTDAISGDLQAMAAGVDRARQHVAAVEHALEQTAARAIASGFNGIAIALRPVREASGQARVQLTAAEETIREGSRSLAAALQQQSPQEVITALTPMAATLSAADSGVAAAAATVERARRLVTAALQGGQPDPILSRLQQVSQCLAAVRARGAEARQHVDAALAQARQVGDISRPSDTPPAPLPAPGPPRPHQPPYGDQDVQSARPPEEVPRPVGSEWERCDPGALPDSVRAAVGRFDVRPAGSTRPTLGLFNGEEITSGGGDRSIAADLDHDPLRGPPVTFYDHVESKAAARMRLTGGESDLAVDNTVCGTNDRDQSYPWTCDKILPAILPQGSRLGVWVTRDGGATWWHRVYVGTGERITR
jgi:hypothetical protein